MNARIVEINLDMFSNLDSVSMRYTDHSAGLFFYILGQFFKFHHLCPVALNTGWLMTLAMCLSVGEGRKDSFPPPTFDSICLYKCRIRQAGGYAPFYGRFLNGVSQRKIRSLSNEPYFGIFHTSSTLDTRHICTLKG